MLCSTSTGCPGGSALSLGHAAFAPPSRLKTSH
jgi:hypothetical protein